MSLLAYSAGCGRAACACRRQARRSSAEIRGPAAHALGFTDDREA